MKQEPPSKKRNRGWIWYFVILIALTITSITVMIVYNLRQQLTPEQFATARALWMEKKPADYDMEYTQAGSMSGTYKVRVRENKIVSVTLDDRELDSHQYPYYDMTGLFNSIDGFMELDRKPDSPRTFTKANFDANDGHIRRFIRRVMGGNERLEINVKLHAAKKNQ